MDGEKSFKLCTGLLIIVDNCDGWTQICDLFDRGRYMSLIVSDTSFVLGKLTFLLRLKSLQERNKVEIKRDYQIVRFRITAAWWREGYIDIYYIGANLLRLCGQICMELDRCSMSIFRCLLLENTHWRLIEGCSEKLCQL